MSDEMKVDPHSGVETDAVLSIEEAQKWLAQTWGPMLEHEVHLVVRRFEDKGQLEGIVIIARGEAARMLSEFCPSIPSYRDED